MRKTLLSVAGLTALLFGCSGADASPTNLPGDDALLAVPTADGSSAVEASCKPVAPVLAGPPLTPFEDESELDNYLLAAATPIPRTRSGASDNAGATGVTLRELAQESSEALSSSSPARASDSPSIQKADIVKGDGDTLFVHHDTHLYAVDVSVSGAPRLIDAYDLQDYRGYQYGTQLLADKDRVYVIRQGTFGGRSVPSHEGVMAVPCTWAPLPSGRLSNSVDILVLQLRDGRLLTESRTRFEEAAPPPDDRNAIRLIDGKLVFHFAIDALQGVNSSSRWKTVIPRRSQRLNPNNSELELTHDLISAKDVYRPLGAPQSSMFDVLVRCQPATDGDLACDAKALVHAGADHLYTSPTHVYWYSPDYIYAWDLSSLDVVTHRIRGTRGREPKATLRNNTLHVALIDVTGPALLSMWSLPLASFDKKGQQGTERRRSLTPKAKTYGYTTAQQFIGSTYLAGVENGYRDEASYMRVIYDVESADEPLVEHSMTEYPLIEPLGNERALFVARPERTDSADLPLEVWTLRPKPARASSALLRGVSDLSHVDVDSFVYRSGEGGQGALALGVERPSDKLQGAGSAQLEVFGLGDDHVLEDFGVFPPQIDADICGPHCLRSAKMIAHEDRSFALLDARNGEGVFVELAPQPSVQQIGQALVLGRGDPAAVW